MPNLPAAFRLGRREMVAFVGGGGKTSLMLELARQLDAASKVVRLGTTASIEASEVAELRHFVYDRVDGDRLLGAAPDHFDGLLRLGWVEVVAVEADDAGGRSVKAPDDNEPIIPRAATQVVAVIGADALDGVIEDQGQRPMRIAAIVGCRPYERLTPERAAVLVCSPRGGRKNVPSMARFTVCVTRVRPERDALVDRFAEAVRAIDPGVTVVRVPDSLGVEAPKPPANPRV